MVSRQVRRMTFSCLVESENAYVRSDGIKVNTLAYTEEHSKDWTGEESRPSFENERSREFHESLVCSRRKLTLSLASKPRPRLRLKAVPTSWTILRSWCLVFD